MFFFFDENERPDHERSSARKCRWEALFTLFAVDLCLCELEKESQTALAVEIVEMVATKISLDNCGT